MINLLRNLGFTRRDIVLFFFLIGIFIFGILFRYVLPMDEFHFDYTSKSALAFEENIKSSFDIFRLEKLKSLRDSLETAGDLTPVSELPVTKININTAYASELVVLPGVGGVTAERIVAYREQKGDFKNITEIMNVKGIGEKKFEKLKNYITVK